MTPALRMPERNARRPGLRPPPNGGGPLDSAAVAALYESLPAWRRLKATDGLLREAAAVRIKLLYPRLAQRFVRDAAFRETAVAVNEEMRLPVEAGGFEVTASYVRSVVYYDR